LLDAFKKKQKELVLSIPEIVDYDTNLKIYFSGSGHKQCRIYQDVYIDYYREYLSANFKGNLTIKDLQKHSINLCDDDGISHKNYSVFKGILFDCEINNNCYHLCEGNWYQIDTSYLKKLENFLNPYFYEDSLLGKYTHKSEGDYNLAIAQSNKKVICLDKENISPQKQTSLEPCDLYMVKDKIAIFYHVKLSTRSSTISHLFNQGLNSIELLRTVPETKDKLKKMIESKVEYLDPINNDKLQVVYAIITHKNGKEKSRNLPLFSRISLKRCINTFKIMNIAVKICFVEDSSDKKPSEIRKRIKKIDHGSKNISKKPLAG
jgi:uncharacterized protein (TIGR04141 family)